MSTIKKASFLKGEIYYKTIFATYLQIANTKKIPNKIKIKSKKN